MKAITNPDYLFAPIPRLFSVSENSCLVYIKRNSQWCHWIVCHQCPLITTARYSDLSADTKTTICVTPTLKQLGLLTIVVL